MNLDLWLKSVHLLALIINNCLARQRLHRVLSLWRSSLFRLVLR